MIMNLAPIFTTVNQEDYSCWHVRFIGVAQWEHNSIIIYITVITAWRVHKGIVL